MPLSEIKNRQYPEHHIGVKNFRPMFVDPMDPAKHEGAYRMFMRLLEILELQYNSGYYLPMRFDVNIYNFFLKVHS